MKRSSGILLHISSLPSDYGIGTMGRAAYEFVDFLSAAGQKYWQILPCNMTGYANSPYQSLSAYAGNIYFIDLDRLSDRGYLEPGEYRTIDWGAEPERVDYQKLCRMRLPVLKRAAARFTVDQKYLDYCRENESWLEDYALFMAIKEHHGMAGFERWEHGLKFKQSEALQDFSIRNAAGIDFYKITQFWFSEQYSSLKQYAHNRGLQIIGDMPFYIAYDSADVWSNPHLFELSENYRPLHVAGVPPDAFSDDGQLWGNPLYDYDKMKQDDFRWLKERISFNLKLYDLLRLDHFRAFDSYYAVPYGRRDARIGEWRKGLGYEFFERLNLLDSGIIAEDLGDINENTRLLIEKTGFPNMKILQFAFNTDSHNEFLPFNYRSNNCVVYTGTHDNNTVKGWYRKASWKEKANLFRFVPRSFLMPKSGALIEYAMSSAANLIIIPMQDYLNLGEYARMNTPSTVFNNWEWRMRPSHLSESLSSRIYKLTQKYHR